MTREDKILKLASDYIANLTESCPNDVFGFYNNCSNNCNNQFEECWKEYILYKVGE